MTKLRATSIAVFLTVAAVALGACGDDEGCNESATTGTDATETTTGTTEKTATAETTETGTTETRERAGKTNTTKRKRKRGGSGGGSDDSSGSGGGGNSGSAPAKELTGKNVRSTSKTVCSQFLPTALAKDLKEGKKSAEDIAKDYARGYPEAQRKSAYDGCLAGLKTRD
jgi:hypothetical protein